jgi:hypothetical protein
MFVGHFGAALLAKKATPRLSLGTLFVACQWLDLVWPVLVLAGVEHVRVEPGVAKFNPFAFDDYPWSHSLGMTVVWALAAGGVALLWKRTMTEAVVLGGLVMSHWVLDYVTHVPDLPLWFGHGPKVGLGLWQSVWATIAVELAIFGSGIFAFARTTTAKTPRSRWRFWCLIFFLTLVYLASAFGPQPSADTPAAAIAGPALFMWLLVFWAWWADRRNVVLDAREPTGV